MTAREQYAEVLAAHRAKMFAPERRRDGYYVIRSDHAQAVWVNMTRDVLALAAALPDPMGECICNTGPDTDGPDEECPLHGRSLQEWITRGDLLAARAEAAEAEAMNNGQDYDRRGERLWRLAAKAGHVPSEADNDATAELAVMQALAALPDPEQAHRDKAHVYVEPPPSSPHGFCVECSLSEDDDRANHLPGPERAVREAWDTAIATAERQTDLTELMHFERPSDFRKGVLTVIVALREARPVTAPTVTAAVWPDNCTCDHAAHLHDIEADPVLCVVCGDNTRCNYASPEEIAADRWEEGHAQGVIDYMRRYDSGLTPGERILRAVEMVEPWDDNPYRADGESQP